MPGSTLSVFSEPDELQAALQRGGRVELLVTAGGQFQARLVRITLPRLRLLAVEEWLLRIAFVSPATDSVAIILPVDREPSQTWAGIALQPGDIVTISAGQPVHGRTEGYCRSGVICLPAKDLTRNGRAMNGAGFAISPGVEHWHPASAAFRSLRRLANAAIHVTEARPGIPAGAEAARELEQELIAALVECLSGRPVERGAIAQQRRTEVMARMENILRANPDRLPSQKDLCAALGVPGRTLSAYCRQSLHMGPGRYLRLRQMATGPS